MLMFLFRRAALAWLVVLVARAVALRDPVEDMEESVMAYEMPVASPVGAAP